MSPTRSRDNDVKDANDLADIAEEAQLVPREKMDRALQLSHETGRPLWRILLREGMATDEALFKALGAELRVPVLGEDQLASVIVPDELKTAVTYELAQRLGVLPLERSTDGRRAALAMIDPTLDITPLWPALTPIGVVEVRRFLMSLSTLRLGLEQFYGKPYQPDRAEAFPRSEEAARQAAGSVVLDPQMQAEIAKYSGEHPEAGARILQSTLPIELRTTMPLGLSALPRELGEEPTSSQLSADKTDPHRARLPTPPSMPSARSGPPAPSSISAPPSGRSLPPSGQPSGKSLQPPPMPAQMGGLPRPKSLPPRPPPSRRTPLPELPSAELVLDEVAGASRATRDTAAPQAPVMGGTASGPVPAAQPRSVTGPQAAVPSVPIAVTQSNVTQPRSVTGPQPVVSSVPIAVTQTDVTQPRSVTAPQPVVPTAPIAVTQSNVTQPRSVTAPHPVVSSPGSGPVSIARPRSATGPQPVVPSSSSLAPSGGAGEERVHDALLLACEALVSQHEAQLRSTWPTELAHLGQAVAAGLKMRPRAVRELMLVARLFGLQRVLLSQRGALPPELSTLVGFLGTVPFSAPLRELQSSLVDFMRVPAESAAPLGARIVRAAARALSLWAEGVSEESLVERLRQTGVDRDVAEAVYRAIEQEPPDREDLRLPPAPLSISPASSPPAPVSTSAPDAPRPAAPSPASVAPSASPPAPVSTSDAPRPPAEPVPPSRLSSPSAPPSPPLLRPLWPLPPRMPDVPWTTRVVPTLSGETLVPHRPEEL